MLEVPLGLMVIVAGGGMNCAPDAGTVSLALIVSIPLRQLLEGLLASKMWCTEPVAVGLGGFMASLTRTLPSSLAGLGECRNLIVIMPKYMDITLRLGYHSIIIEAYISEAVEDNSIFSAFSAGQPTLSAGRGGPDSSPGSSPISISGWKSTATLPRAA